MHGWHMFRAAGMGRQPPPGLDSCPLKALTGRVKASSPASRYEAPRAEGDWLGRALSRSSALQDNGASERCGEPGKNWAPANCSTCFRCSIQAVWHSRSATLHFISLHGIAPQTSLPTLAHPVEPAAAALSSRSGSWLPPASAAAAMRRASAAAWCASRRSKLFTAWP